MNNSLMVDTLGKLLGYHIRVRELHWFVIPDMNLHKQLEDFDSDLYKFIDEITEDTQCMFGKITPGEITPILPEETDFRAVLRGIRVLLASLKDQMTDKCWTGVISNIDGFWHIVNKNLYLLG